MNIRTLNMKAVWILSATILLLAGAATVLAEETPEPRLSTTSEGKGITRGSVGDGKVSHSEFETLATKGGRDGSSRGSLQRQFAKSSLQAAGTASSTTNAAASNVDFWIYDADVQLFADTDRDGFYSGIDLAFDADTVYTVADVYAVVYLSRDFGPWNEYASTDTFAIFGASGDDEYIIETDLVSGYPSGEYDILIELFDAFDDTFVASVGPEEMTQLSFLPLEDIGRDTPPGTTIVVNEGGGGAVAWFGLLGLLAATVLSRRRRAILIESAD